MDKQTKTLLGIGAIAVALYFILRPKGTSGGTPSGTPSGTIVAPCSVTDSYCNYVISSGTLFEGKIVGSSVSITDTPKSQWDSGSWGLREGEFKILEIVKDGVKDDALPFQKKEIIDGFELYNGAIVKIITTKDIVANYPNKPIIYT
jgi:hypothetical protein